MSARRAVRFVLDGQLAVSLTAHLPRTSSQQPVSLSVASRGKGAVSRKRASRPSLPSDAAMTDGEGDTTMTAAGTDDGGNKPHPAALASPASSLSSATSSPSLLAAAEWSRPLPAQPDVVAVRADLANIALPSAAASNHSNVATTSSHPPPPPPPLHASSISLAPPPPSSTGSSAVAPLSSQLLGSMLNVSNEPSTAEVDANQWPYSGPQLARARMKAAFPAIIPSSARWFDPSSIAAVERRMFPDWLSGAVGRYAAAAAARSDWYQHIRNAIVAAYRANPRVFLTVTACRRQLAADVGAITRIHTFLQQVTAATHSHCTLSDISRAVGS